MEDLLFPLIVIVLTVVNFIRVLKKKKGGQGKQLKKAPKKEGLFEKLNKALEQYRYKIQQGFYLQAAHWHLFDK